MQTENQPMKELLEAGNVLLIKVVATCEVYLCGQVEKKVQWGECVQSLVKTNPCECAQHQQWGQSQATVPTQTVQPPQLST